MKIEFRNMKIADLDAGKPAPAQKKVTTTSQKTLTAVNEPLINADILEPVGSDPNGFFFWSAATWRRFRRRALARAP
jgi:hypothetical protein